MSEYSFQHPCTPDINDAGPLTKENLAAYQYLTNSADPSEDGVLWFRDAAYTPDLPGITGTVDGLLDASEAAGVVTVQSGVAIVNGRIYVNDANILFDINGNPGNANATDVIVLRWTEATNQVRMIRLNGPAGAKASLTQTATVWDVPIWDIVLTAGGAFLSLHDFRQLAHSTNPTKVLIEEQTLNFVEQATTITFSNIPQMFDELELVVHTLAENTFVSRVYEIMMGSVGGLIGQEIEGSTAAVAFNRYGSPGVNPYRIGFCTDTASPSYVPTIVRIPDYARRRKGISVPFTIVYQSGLASQSVAPDARYLHGEATQAGYGSGTDVTSISLTCREESGATANDFEGPARFQLFGIRY